jgi:hypothetical protein
VLIAVADPLSAPPGQARRKPKFKILAIYLIESLPNRSYTQKSALLRLGTTNSGAIGAAFHSDLDRSKSSGEPDASSFWRVWSLSVCGLKAATNLRVNGASLVVVFVVKRLISSAFSCLSRFAGLAAYGLAQLHSSRAR